MPRDTWTAVWMSSGLARIWRKKMSKPGEPTAKLSWLGDWENEAGHFPETETNPFILYVGEKCHEGALK